MPRVQFCPQGHDTFKVGRNKYRRCNECNRIRLNVEWYKNNYAVRRYFQRLAKRIVVKRQRLAQLERELKGLLDVSEV